MCKPRLAVKLMDRINTDEFSSVLTTKKCLKSKIVEKLNIKNKKLKKTIKFTNVLL